MIEQQMISELVVGSMFTKHMNFLLFNVGLHAPCETSTCEKYLCVGTNLKFILQNRGERLNEQNVGVTPNYLNAGNRINDIILTKFLYFSETEQEIINVIRKHAMKCYITIIVEESIVFNRVKQYIISAGMFNIYIIRMGPNKKSYTLYEICAFCRSGITEMKAVNVWSYKSSFKKPVKYIPSFKGAFFGATLRVGLRLQMPAIYITGRQAGGIVTFSGSEYMVLQTLSKSLNFKFVIKQPKDGKSCYVDNITKSSGVCGMLVRNEADIAGFVAGIFDYNFPAVDPTGIYYISGRVIVSATPPLNTLWTSSSAAPIILILILLCYLVLSTIYCIIGRFWHHDPTAKYIHTLVLFFSILWLEAVRLKQLRSLQMMILGMWMVVSYFLMSNAFGQITSVRISAGPSRDPIDSVEAMAKNKISWVTHHAYRFDHGLIRKEIMYELSKKKLLMNPKEGLEFVQNKPNEYIYYAPRELVEPTIRHYFLGNKSRNPFDISPSLDVPMLITVLVRKDCPYREAFTRKLQQLHSSALHNKFIADTMDMFGKDIKENRESNDPYTPVGLRDVMLAMYAYFMCMLLSAIVFFVEQCKWRLVHQKLQFNKSTYRRAQIGLK